MQSDAVYFSRRASEERDAAGNAACATAREAHLEMAERYDELATALEERDAVASTAGPGA